MIFKLILTSKMLHVREEIKHEANIIFAQNVGKGGTPICEDKR